MPWWVWLALGIGLAAPLAALALAVVRGLEVWRLVKRTGATLGEAADDVTAGVEAIGAKADALGGAAERTSVSLERLAVSRARLTVLLEAAAEARSALTRLTSVVPRK